MPSRCGCADTCACVVQGGNGVEVSGIGTVDRPYVVSADSAVLSDKIVFTSPTETIEFETSGTGTSSEPLRVLADATLKLTDLTDVETGSPNSGEVPVWQSDHWEFQPPPVAPPGAVNATNGIGGDGSFATPLKLLGSGVWPLANFPATQDGLSGNEVYVDSAGQVRAKPGVITVAKPVTDLAPTYPQGTTVMLVDASTGAAYPVGGLCTVVTHRRSDGYATQWCSSSVSATVTQVWVRAGTTTAWAPWTQIADPPLPGVVGTYQPTDISVSTSARHVEGSPACRVQVTNPHTSRSMLVRTTLSCWMSITNPSGGPSFYVDIDNLSGASLAAPGFAGQTAAETRWAMPDATIAVILSANFGIDWIVAAGATAIWYPAAAQIGGSSSTRSMRATRLSVTPLRYL